MRKPFKPELSSTQVIMLSFLLAILAGSFLLALPVSSASGQAVSYMDALFMATSATCVTGMTTLPCATTWSFFGQFVILILIQIGGLGVVTILAGLMISLHQNINLKNRMILQDSFNLNSLAGLIKFTKQVLLGTLLVEAIGAIIFMVVLVPKYGIRGIWYAVFHSVSSFCNAGITIFSDSGMYDYTLHPLMNLTTAALVILGGIGFIVWWDFMHVLKNFPKQRQKCFKSLTLHSKITITSTIVLLLAGTIFYLIFESNNPLTLGNYAWYDKLQVAFFQSTTTRAAGFASIAQENLSNPSAIFTLLLMFIGGSPVGTAGGIKTVTFVVLIAAMATTVFHQNEVVLFHRTITKQTVTKAVAVTSMSFMTLFISSILLSAVTNADIIDIIYEAAGATTTVGLTHGLTSQLNFWGRLIIIFTMYFGRIGPISLVVAFNLRRENPNIIKNPSEEINVG